MIVRDRDDARSRRVVKLNVAALLANDDEAGPFEGFDNLSRPHYWQSRHTAFAFKGFFKLTRTATRFGLSLSARGIGSPNAANASI